MTNTYPSADKATACQAVYLAWYFATIEHPIVLKCRCAGCQLRASGF